MYGQLTPWWDKKTKKDMTKSLISCLGWELNKNQQSVQGWHRTWHLQGGIIRCNQVMVRQMHWLRLSPSYFRHWFYLCHCQQTLTQCPQGLCRGQQFLKFVISVINSAINIQFISAVPDCNRIYFPLMVCVVEKSVSTNNQKKDCLFTFSINLWEFWDLPT